MTAEELQQAAHALGVQLAPTTAVTLFAYIDLLEKWNRAYNLTAIRRRDDMIVGHLLDSLSIAPYISGKRVLDVGTGAGLPGLVLAIHAPDRRFDLLDSNGKKTRFLTEAVRTLGLTNVDIQRTRVESFAPVEQYDHVCSRAFTALPEFVTLCGRLVRPGGNLLAMLGKAPDSELSELPNPFKLHRCLPLAVPGLDAPRHLAIITGP